MCRALLYFIISFPGLLHLRCLRTKVVMDQPLGANPLMNNYMSKDMSNPIASLNSILSHMSNNMILNSSTSPVSMNSFTGMNSDAVRKTKPGVCEAVQPRHASIYGNSPPNVTIRNRVAPYPTPQHIVLRRSTPDNHMQQNGPSMQYYGGGTQHEFSGTQDSVAVKNLFLEQACNFGVKQPSRTTLNSFVQQAMERAARLQISPYTKQTELFYPQPQTQMNGSSQHQTLAYDQEYAPPYSPENNTQQAMERATPQQTSPYTKQTELFYPQPQTQMNGSSQHQTPAYDQEYAPQYSPQNNTQQNVTYRPSTTSDISRSPITPTSDVTPYCASNPNPTFPEMRETLLDQKDDELRLTLLVRDGIILGPFRLQHNLTVSNYVFNLKPSLLRMLMEKSDLELQLKCYHHKDVQMKTYWPAFVEVSVNAIPLSIDRDENNISTKPLFLKRICQSGKNTIQFIITACCCTHFFLLQLVHRPTVKSVMQDLSKKKLLYSPNCIEKIKRNFTLLAASANVPLNDGEDGVELAAIKVSLNCPISRKRMSIPTRGKECMHVQCFDLESYLVFNSQRGSWRCPVCNKLALLKDLEVDQYIWGIKTNLTYSGVEEITIDSSGSWKPVHMKTVPVGTTTTKEESDKRIKCLVCCKFVSPDNVECHLSMCLTKPRIIHNFYNEDVLTEDKGECVICFEELTKGNVIARLPCLCIYHKTCIDAWFKINHSCPTHPALD